MSSAHHESFTRIFANEGKRPVFAIDYRLAPNTKYPENLHDCIRSYFWIIDFVENVVGTDLESIILVGDSAGGNLACALTAWLIENKQRKPDLLALCYASLSIKLDGMAKSYVLSLKDAFLNYYSMKTVRDMYLPVGECDESEDYYINPVQIPDHILKKFPKTRILVCENDPLRDDQIRIARRL